MRERSVPTLISPAAGKPNKGVGAAGGRRVRAAAIGGANSRAGAAAPWEAALQRPFLATALGGFSGLGGSCGFTETTVLVNSAWAGPGSKNQPMPAIAMTQSTTSNKPSFIHLPPARATSG